MVDVDVRGEEARSDDPFNEFQLKGNGVMKSAAAATTTTPLTFVRDAKLRVPQSCPWIPIIAKKEAESGLRIVEHSTMDATLPMYDYRAHREAQDGGIFYILIGFPSNLIDTPYPEGSRR
ncbi:hypothetical protein K0M31_017682 [Melipona bicolor]|uniref:Uncharacterized protein n=1 Tax=Melipona bicolor TaxID=60889 RepID=A0AA40KSS2_9HYME|nr:hypothetical protein K0M31_017682 [Melipona bicolor]